MKRILVILVVVGITANMIAQSPENISYQAVVRDANHSLIQYQTIGMQISILQDTVNGAAVYIETHTPSTNINGLVSIEIGNGTIISGDFATINWGDGQYFLKTEIDLIGGANYTISGTNQLLSVPYALFAKTADHVIETDPVFMVSPAGDITEADILYWNNKLDEEVDGDITNELQILSISNDTISLTDGGYAVLPLETDPLFDASVASGITGTDTAYWSDHTDSTDIANMGYISGPGGGTATYSIGDFAHGGVVFWVDATGTHGLVCAKEDQGVGDEKWYAGTFGYTRANGDGIFAGEMNTSIIIAAHVAIGDNGSTYAARMCNELQMTEGGITYGDWYLPSKEELNLMYQNRTIINATSVANGGSYFDMEFFWSSTEYSNISAWSLDFLDGMQLPMTKNSMCAVRAVRVF